MQGVGREGDGSDDDECALNANGRCDDELAEPKPVRAKFVRCPLCRDKKIMVCWLFSDIFIANGSV